MWHPTRSNASADRNGVLEYWRIGGMGNTPHRIEKLLGELAEIFPERTVVLARELTKKFEEFLRGISTELLAIVEKRSLKGEFVVLIGGTKEEG